MVHNFRIVSFLFCITVGRCLAQGNPAVPPSGPKFTEGHLAFSSPSDPSPTNYILGTDDQVVLSVTELPEVTAIPMRVDQMGDINVPLAGRVHAAGLTINELETSIEKKLTEFVWQPHALITLNEVKSQPVTFMGEIATPGIHQLAGHKTLFEMISACGGLRPDAGSAIHITRDLRFGAIPLPDAKNDPTGKYSVASVPTKNIGDAAAAAENIVLMPGDIVNVTKAEMVYVIGSVRRPGGFVLGQEVSISAMKALVLAFGLDKGAAGNKAHITRTDPVTSAHVEIPINLKKLLAGKTQDIPLQSNDVLYVPSSVTGTILTRSAEAGIQLGTQLAIYHF